MQLLFLMSAYKYSALTYERPGGVYVYPGWAVGLGWSLAGISIALVPIMTLYNGYKFIRSGKVRYNINFISNSSSCLMF